MKTLLNKRLKKEPEPKKLNDVGIRRLLSEDIRNYLNQSKRIVTHGQNGIHIKQTT